MTNLERITDDLQAIRDGWPALYDAADDPGRHNARLPLLTTEQRALRDQAAAAERRDRDPDAPGQTPAPGGAALGLLDVVADATDRMIGLEDAARRHFGWARLCGRCRHEADSHAEACAVCRCPAYRAERWSEHGEGPVWAVPWACKQLAGWLPVIDDLALLQRIGGEAREVRHRMQVTIGDLDDGMALYLLCAFCRGRTAAQPEGGEYTLRVHARPGLLAVVCYGMCDPPNTMCGSRLHGRPVWPFEEWDWLASWLEVVNRTPEEAA